MALSCLHRMATNSISLISHGSQCPEICKTFDLIPNILTGYYLTKASANPGAGDILMGFLGSVILSFAFSMFKQRKVAYIFSSSTQIVKLSQL